MCTQLTSNQLANPISSWLSQKVFHSVKFIWSEMLHLLQVGPANNEFAVILDGQRFKDIVKQADDDHLVVFTRPQSPTGRLETMLQ